MAAALLTACGSQTGIKPAEPLPQAPAPEAAGTDVAPAPAVQAPALRLPDTVRPVDYAAELTIDPDATEFTGSIRINFATSADTDILWLNGTDLTVDKARVTAGGETWVVETLPVDSKDFLAFDLGRTLAPGGATIEIDYRGKVVENEYAGLFRQKSGDQWYVYTQFEAMSARRAFPSFDEPRWKTPWELALHVAPDHMALSNTPAVSEKTGQKDGKKTVRFARTKPLPTYLVAMAVGPFEAVEIGKIGRGKVPARIIVTRGKRAEAAYAAETTPVILDYLEDYFDMPYPYEKLDSIEVPHFLGAMENPGLITYASSIIVGDPEKAGTRFKRIYPAVAGHELAHQWFGNLVTLAWWNDIWLNESFATWLAAKVVDQWKPEWDYDLYEIAQIERAMSADSLLTASPIRRTIETKSDVASAFDAISYQKGGAVLSMLERWIGEDTFKQGVRAYMKEHAWGTATSEDFLEAMGTASNLPVNTAFRSFLEQPGVPEVTATLACDKGKNPALTLSQRRYLPAGTERAGDTRWQIPVCVKYQAGKGAVTECTLLDEPSETFELTRSKGCPQWVLPNADAAGYYRVAYDADTAGDVLAASEHVSAGEIIRILADLDARVKSGAVEIGAVLALVPSLMKQPGEALRTRTVALVQGVDDRIIEEDLRPSWQRFIVKTFGPQARKLGWKTPAGESTDAKQLRTSLLELVVMQGGDARLAAEGKKLAEAWLADPRSVDPDVAPLALRTAARFGDAAFYETLHQRIDGNADGGQRAMLIGALASFTDPALVARNMEVLAEGKLGLREAAPLMQTPLQMPETRQLVYDHIKENLDAILAKLPAMAHPYIVMTAAVFCDQAHLEDARQFFGPRVEKMPGGDKALKQATERIEVCMAFREAQAPAMKKFLSRY